MPIPAIITGAIIDIAKKQLFKIGKKVAHDFVDSVSGKKLGQLICYRKNEGYNNVLLFVHGFSGNASETFGMTPDMLVEDAAFDGWDVFSIGYSSDIFPSIGKGIWSTNPDITKISQYLQTLLLNQFDDYNRVAFVAHSMGGLAVQRVILNVDPSVRAKMSHVLLFGTPSAGLKKASWFKFWNPQIKDLDENSEFIANLRADWKAAFPNDIPFLFKTIAGSKDEFVGVNSSLAPFDKKYHGVIEGNHISMIKPRDAEDKQHQSFEIILKTLTNQQVQYLMGNPEDINLLLGEYHEVIQKFLPKKEQIGIRELIQLVFALECTKRSDEALDIIEHHPRAKSNSDLQGIIAGRYKRKYLLDSLQDDLDKSLDYYSRALLIAREDQDEKQIFYHAINLAFLYLIAHNNSKKMTAYAQLALDNCKSQNPDLWELATIAEANLYLGKLDVAEEYYTKAANVAGSDIRAKNSIYSNAYLGYECITGAQNNDAAFIKKLEELFLI